MVSLIQDQERGLERADAASRRGRQEAYDRLTAPIMDQVKILGSGVKYGSHSSKEPGFAFPDEVVGPPSGIESFAVVLSTKR